MSKKVPNASHSIKITFEFAIVKCNQITIKFISSDFTYGNSLYQNSPQSLSLVMNPSNFSNFDNVTKVELMKGFDNVEFNLKSIPH